MKLNYGICIAAIGLAMTAQAQTGKALPIDGAMLYATYCVDCHGKGGRGDGPMAATLSAKVPDLTRLAARNGGIFPLTQVEQRLSSKTPSPVTHGGIAMPTWGLVFAGSEAGAGSARTRVHNVARYLETIQR